MKLIVKNNFGEEKIALLNQNNKVERFFIYRPERLNLGEEVTGIIRKKDTQLNGYFIETQKGINVFVPSKELYAQGTHVCVRITKEARRGKDANGIFIPSCKKNDSYSIWLNSQYNIPIENTWDELNLNEALENALQPDIIFSDGAVIHIERTSACWTIDVDSGSSQKSFHELNIAAADIIAHEIQLRCLGGIILIDFIGPKHKNEQYKLAQHLESSLQSDSLSSPLGWTKSKLFEIKRTRTYAPLIDVFLDKNGESNLLTTVYKISEIFTKLKKIPLVIAHPCVIELLRQKLNNRAQFKADISKSIHHFEITE